MTQSAVIGGSSSYRARRRSSIQWIFAGLVALVALVMLVTPSPARAAGQTVVSLTFDDGTDTQYWALSQLQAHNMTGTFYVNSSKIGQNGYMTWSQLHDLYNAGNEIGGHTSYHVNLPNTDPAEAKRQICDDRVNLINQGFQPQDFAYPFGAFNSSVEQMVAACGYNSARTVNPVTAESTPPPDPYATRIVGESSNLQTLENSVTNTIQHGGGWAPIVFHQLCNACDTDWNTQADFTAFLDWLQGQAANGVVVQNVNAVMGGSLKPGVFIPYPSAPNGWSVLRNSSLEYSTSSAASGGAPDCFEFDGYGSNNAKWSWVNDAHTGSWAERVDVSNYVSGDNKLRVKEDLGRCTPSVTPGHKYTLSVWYKSNAPMSFTTFTRDSLGAFNFWQESPQFPASSTWKQAVWTTPAIPTGVNGMTFAPTIESNGFFVVDDYGIQDASPTGGADTTAPSVSIASPANGSSQAGAVPINVTASDNVAVDHLDYLVDGSVVSSETDGLNAYTWQTRSVANGPHTIAVRAVDPAGNSTTTNPITVVISNSQVNLLQNPSLESGSGSTPTCWLQGGYGTNTFTWTRTSDAHTGSFAENLNVGSWTSGDRKLLNTQDSGTCAPAATPGHSYLVSAWYKIPSGTTSTPRFFAYYRNSAGSWTYWTQSPTFASNSNWTQASWNTPAIPAGATNISVGMGLDKAGSVTMDDFILYDNSPPADTTPPTTTISCAVSAATSSSDTTGCASGWYGDQVQVNLASTDNLGGSGVSSIRYTTDGTDPSMTNGSTYAGPFSVASTTTVKYRAYDFAGNAEPIRTQLIQIDTTPPSSTITCAGATCQAGWYNQSISVGLQGTDTGGAGVAFIRYTTDGSDPSLSNGNDYVGRVSLSSTTTVKYRAYDNAGNAEAVNTELIRIDTTAPDSGIGCNGSDCQGSWYTSATSISLTATDDSGGSGVSAIYYTTDGSTPVVSDADRYTGAFPIGTTTTVNYFSVDNAGNAEPMNSTLVRVDGAAPTSSITCNGSTCPSGWATSAQTVALSATDNSGGSGVASIMYTTDGSDPSMTHGSTYSGSFSVSSTTTVKYRAYDNAGNAEPVNTQSIQVDSASPSSTISCNGAPCSSSLYAPVVNVTLDAADNPSGSGVAAIYYTTDGSAPTQTTSDLYTGAFPVILTTTVKYFAVDNAGNAEAVNSRTISVAPQGVLLTSPLDGATVSGTTNLTAAVTGINVDHVTFFVDGQAVDTISGLALYSVPWDSTTVPDGSHTVVAAAFDSSGGETDSAPATINVVNNAGDTTPPTSTISCNGSPCGSSWYGSPVSVTLSASDDPGGSGVASIRYTTDGSDPSLSNGLVYNGSFAVSSPTTVKYRAYDNAGNAEAINSQLIQADTVAPQSSISCNNAQCASSFYTNTVSVSLSAGDNSGGSGVYSILYTTDGSDPTPSNGISYTGPFAVNSTTTVKYRAYDNAGNAEAINSQLIQVDTTPPSSTANCNGSACNAAWYNGSVSMTLSATDGPGGSGVASIRYTTDGSDPSLTNGLVYNGSFSVASTTTVKYRAYDNAGNAEPVNTQRIQIDTVAPQSSIACNGVACASSFYKAAVTVTLSASDNSGGSGVSSIVYTTDGSMPSATNGTTYTGAFSINTTTFIRYRAIDNAGNIQSVSGATIKVDVTPPTSTIACNGGSCSGWFKPGASVSLSATDDSGGSGVASIRYTTDGSTPTSTTGTVYSAPFTVNATTTIKYRAFDNVGNAEAVNTQSVQIDGTAPTASLTSPSAGLNSGTVTLSANVGDNVGIDHVDFLVDGNVVATDTSTPYTYSWNSQSVADGSHSITARAVDLAGNSTTSAAVSVTLINNNLVQNPSLETASGSTPTCWLLGGYGTNTFTWTRTSDAHTGSFAENLNITAWTSGDRKLLSAQDTGACAPAGSPGHKYTVTAWYKVPTGSATPYFYAYYRSSAGTWTFWSQSATLASSSSWTFASWTTTALPAGATNVSVGMGLGGVGTVTLDDFGLFQTG